MNPISGYAKLAIAAAAVAALAAGAYFTVRWYDGQISTAYDHGVQTERASWTAKESAQKSADLLVLTDKAKADFATQVTINNTNRQVEQDHAKAAQDLKAYRTADDARIAAAGGLRIDRTTLCGGGNSADGAGLHASAQAAGTGSNDAWIASTVALPAELQRAIYALLDEADRVTETARTAQNWVIGQGYYGPASDAAATPSPASSP